MELDAAIINIHAHYEDAGNHCNEIFIRSFDKENEEAASHHINKSSEKLSKAKTEISFKSGTIFSKRNNSSCDSDKILISNNNKNFVLDESGLFYKKEYLEVSKPFPSKCKTSLSFIKSTEVISKISNKRIRLSSKVMVLESDFFRSDNDDAEEGK